MPTEARIPDFVPPSFADPQSGRIILLADDLTGACDAGAAFLRSGRSVRVWFGTGVEFSTPESVQAFSTSSRALSPHRAARAVSMACTALADDPNSLFFKKVDSAARGPLAAELLAAHRTLASRAILFALAFPSAGRTVRDGTLEIEDAAGQHSQIRLERLFPLSVRGRIFHVSHARELAPALDAGKSLLICDSANQADLDALARAANGFPGLLYAGSAGLAQALAGLIPVRTMASLTPATTRTLLIVGTSHPVTKLQLQELDSTRPDGVRVLRLRLPFSAAARIRSAFRSYAPQALILTGGETAQLAVRALGAHSFILQGEFAPGIPWGVVQGGDAHGCTVVTKSGGFGSPAAFNEILAALRGRA
ncbi:MAG: four-carbon acid sugar kinase family protein [Terracidiphilus sp.]